MECGQTYIPYDPEDKIHFGAFEVVAREKEHILRRRPQAAEEGVNGLALSGGGIRSACFSLGVLQALAHNGWLKRIDYLSTVSGGGYIGSSLTWMLYQGQGAGGFGVDPDNFPFRTYPMSGAPLNARLEARGKGRITPVRHGKLLRYLRQRARYLTPGDGIGAFSLAAVILRGVLLSTFVYLSGLVLLFYPALQGGLLQPGPPWVNPVLTAAGGFLGLFVLASLAYGCASHRLAGGGMGQGRAYRWRQGFERGGGWLLQGALALSVVGAIPWLHAHGGQWASGLASSAVGLASALTAFRGREVVGRLPLGFWVGLASLALGLGLLLLAYHMALVAPPLALALTAVLALVVGGRVNINYVSLHRYYRDRLMELFMPDLDKVERDCPATRAAGEADKTPLSKILVPGADTPYHLINTHVILTDSENPKFRARGGDSFLLSPYYCGSNATGWVCTEKFMGDRMTLPTAMAISGAAVNPHAGAGGEGPTRQRLLSQLMTFLNLRLGYWIPNPRTDRRQGDEAMPNFISPGLWEVCTPRGMANEARSPLLQLSDGGHFDNMGLYELVRRRCRRIILCDAEADPDFRFTGLANALEKIRTDFGVLVDLDCRDLEHLVPREVEEGGIPCAKTGFLCARIIYPDDTQGCLIYLKSTFFAGLSADLCSYKKTHRQFPDQPTSDQFFDEKQFEAYRELGFQTAWAMMQQVPDFFDHPMS